MAFLGSSMQFPWSILDTFPVLQEWSPAYEARMKQCTDLCLTEDFTSLLAVFFVHFLGVKMDMLEVFGAGGFFSCPFCHLWLTSLPIVIKGRWVILWSWREEFNCGVTLHTKSASKFLVFSRIHLCHFHLSLQVCRQQCPLRSQPLAMSTLSSQQKGTHGA